MSFVLSLHADYGSTVEAVDSIATIVIGNSFEEASEVAHYITAQINDPNVWVSVDETLHLPNGPQAPDVVIDAFIAEFNKAYREDEQED